jgi:hypothetical protein
MNRIIEKRAKRKNMYSWGKNYFMNKHGEDYCRRQKNFWYMKLKELK